MFGYSSWPVIFASAMNRARSSGEEPSSITFMAIFRSMVASCASRIAPIPPCATTPPMHAESYSPMIFTSTRFRRLPSNSP